MMKIDSKDLTYIKEQASLLKVDPNALLAIIEVESGGVIGNPLPIIRWEGHYFDRLVPANLRDRARNLGLSSPSAGKIKNPKTQSGRYEIVEKAAALDKEAAYSSISIGVGQVMGSHAKDLGYPSAEVMFNRAKQGLAGQVELLIRYIQTNGLIDELRRLDWSAFARGYNGPNYAAGQYHTKIKAAFERLTGGSIVSTNGSAAGMLRLGSKGAKVREVQQILVRAGFPVTVDGDFGPSTKDAVKAFQRKYKLEADGVVGPATQKELLTWKVTPDEKVGQPIPIQLPGVKNGLNLGIVAGLIFMLQQFFTNWLDKPIVVVAVILVMIGAYVAYDSYKKTRVTYEGVK